MRISDWSSDVCSSDLIGIPKRALNRLGYPFEVVDERVSRAKGGSGLGLALSKALVDLHHGEMLIRSKIDVGTSVTVRSEEHTSELQSLMRISYAVFCLKKKK